MAKIVRLTESVLRSMITESVKKIFESQMEGQDDNGGMWNSADWYEYEAAQELNEGRNDEPSNTHYAIHKPTGKIVFSWDYTGYDPEDLKLYKKDYFTVDLLDMGMDPKEITVITRKSCEKRGIDPTDDANWSNYPMSESLIKEIGDTPKGQRALGGLTARKKLAHKDHMPTYRYAEKARGGDDWDKFAYPNATIDAANPMYKDYAQGYTDYLNAHPDEMMDYERKKYLQEAAKGYSTTTIDINLDEIEFPQPLNDFIDDNYDSMPDTVEVEISYKYNPYTPATYWQPAEGGDFDYSCSGVLVEPFQDIIPQELLQTFIDTIGDYADANIDELFERANINYDDGPDPDEAYESWRDSQYED